MALKTVESHNKREIIITDLFWISEKLLPPMALYQKQKAVLIICCCFSFCWKWPDFGFRACEWWGWRDWCTGRPGFSLPFSTCKSLCCCWFSSSNWEIYCPWATRLLFTLFSLSSASPSSASASSCPVYSTTAKWPLPSPEFCFCSSTFHSSLSTSWKLTTRKPYLASSSPSLLVSQQYQ